MGRVLREHSFEFLHDTRLVVDAVAKLASSSTIDERGAIFTRVEVVDFILDLVGYTTSKKLYQLRLLEPSIGDGDFLIPCIKRLVKSWKKNASKKSNAEVDLINAITAVELHADTLIRARRNIEAVLLEEGLTGTQVKNILDKWLIQGDFLIQDLHGEFDFVVGNPPYVRQELIPAVLMSEYRKLYDTIYDRADLYIPFIERSLKLLSKKGHLGFICSDRWMKNKYGGPLRKFIADYYHLKFYVDMVDTPAFQSDVIAYPAVFVINKERNTKTRIAHRPKIDQAELSNLAKALCANDSPNLGSPVQELNGIVTGSEPWVLESLDQLSIVRRLEANFPLLEEVGCKVGIGVATGSDKAFIGPFDELDVEDDRKIPLATTRDLKDGKVVWKGLGVINPFDNDGSLVDLKEYPRLKKYLHKRKDEIQKRHVATKNPNNWYRTIDRIYPSLTKKKKLLIPDIKGEAIVVLEKGRLYPHHNLYYIISEEWNLEALQAVFRSGIARLFVSTYSTKMRGGYLRFQAQYLRRIRIPKWSNVSDDIKKELLAAIKQKNEIACNEAVFKLYGLTKSERQAIGGNGE